MVAVCKEMDEGNPGVGMCIAQSNTEQMAGQEQEPSWDFLHLCFFSSQSPAFSLFGLSIFSLLIVNENM